MKVFVITGCTSENNLGYKIAKAIKEKIKDAYVVGVCASVFDPLCDYSFFDQLTRADLSTDCKVDISSYAVETHGIYALINAAGWNSLQWFDEKFNWATHEKIMNINFNAPCRLFQHMLSDLKKANGTVLNIISMGAVKPFRTSFSYNTSKAALRMATIQLAREHSDLTIFGISPNELDGTEMTNYTVDQVCKVRGWSAKEADEYRISNSISSDRTDPNIIAEFIAHILQSKNHHRHFTGCDIQYGT